MTAERALVLGGGGVAGIAWETGLVVGLTDAGVDVASADLVVGTSSGSVVAAQLASGVPLQQVLDVQLDPGSDLEPQIDVDVPRLWADMAAIMQAELDPVAALRRIGDEIALAQDRVPEPERRAIIERRLPVHEWPHRALEIPAIDAHSGERVVFDRDSGVGLVDAVMASCALPRVWPAATIGGRRYMDGGTRSLTNADLAAGHARVLVVEAMRLPPPWSGDLEPLGPHTEARVIDRDEASLAAVGEDPMDPSVRPASARAGYDQGRRLAADVGAFWQSG